MKKKRIVIATGGTGGHVFPAQALAEQLGRLDNAPKILFVGGKLGANAFFDKSFYTFQEVHCGRISLKHPFKAFAGAWEMVKGIIQSIRVLKAFKPDVVVGFGSYHSFPVLVAARWLSLPIVLHEGNVVPGKVNRLFSSSARVTAITFPDTSMYLRGKTVEVEMPLREGYNSSFTSKVKARHYFDLDGDKITLLVFGGSQGAASLNALATLVVTELSHRLKEFQILHFTGAADATAEIDGCYKTLGVRACVRTFEPRMDLAWQAASVSITRAGAMSLLEQIEMEVPGIVIPYPYAAHDHQSKNADFMVRRVGGAIKFKEATIDPDKVVDAIMGILTHEEEGIGKMQQSMRRYKQGRQRRDLCSLVCEVSGIDTLHPSTPEVAAVANPQN